MLGRNIRSRLDLLWPSEAISAKVAQRQDAQRRYHPGSRVVDIPPESPVMVREYTTGTPKWTPATMMEKTGPLSYRCQLQGGRTVRRHQDQIITCSGTAQEPTVTPETMPIPPSESKPNFPPDPTMVDYPGTLPNPAPNQETEMLESSMTSIAHRSNRDKKPVVRMNL